MRPSRAVWQAQATLLASDTTGLASADAMHVHLCKSPFVPSLDLDIGTLEEADFTGAAALAAGTGTQPTYYDSLDGLFTIRIKEPAGGWAWICTATPADPMTIYGWYLTDNDDAVLLGSGLLESPVTIDASGQGVTVGEITLKFSEQYPQ